MLAPPSLSSIQRLILGRWPAILGGEMRFIEGDVYVQGVCIGFVRVEDLSRSARIGNVMVHNSLHWPGIWKIFASTFLWC